jgi:hypothetical protein
VFGPKTTTVQSAVTAEGTGLPCNKTYKISHFVHTCLCASFGSDWKALPRKHVNTKEMYSIIIIIIIIIIQNW